MNGPILSIVIPVYNAEKYLEACVNSILFQDFRDFELILVNDGSTDGSGEICNNYSKRDVRIRTFHKENGGVSTARNLGLAHSLGEWLYFVDADDSIVKDLFSKVFSNDLERIDIVRFGYNLIDVNSSRKIGSTQEKLYRSADEFILDNTLKVFTLWTHFVRKSLISKNDLTFTLGLKYAEDLEFMIKCYSLSKGIKITTLIGYNYYIRESSAMSKAFTFVNAKLHLNVASNLIDFYESKGLIKGDFLRSRVDYMLKSYFSFSTSEKLTLPRILEISKFFNSFCEENKSNLGILSLIMKICRASVVPYIVYLTLKK